MPSHLDRGLRGETAAREMLMAKGLRFLAANFRDGRGEIDLIFGDGDCLVFVEVKTRNPKAWLRPAAAVNRAKKRLLSKTALGYLRRLQRPAVRFRFDVVEVLMDDQAILEIRHLPNAFPLDSRRRYG